MAEPAERQVAALDFLIRNAWQIMHVDRKLAARPPVENQPYWRDWAIQNEVELRALLGVRKLARAWRRNGVTPPQPAA